MALEYTARDIRDIEYQLENLKKGIAALDWMLDATMDHGWDCRSSLCWLHDIIAKSHP